jgi:glycerophosphoryl diester phosphodiesterase
VAVKKLVVNNTTLAELKKLDVGIKKGTAFENTSIPTIGEVFKTIPAKKKIYIEIKCGLEIIPPLLREVSKSQLEKEQIVFICFDAKIIGEVKMKAPHFKGYWLSDVKQNKDGSFTPSLEDSLVTLRKVKADGMSSSRSGIDDEFISKLQMAGFEHHVWTVNEIKTAQWFANQGTLSVTTDFPGRIKEALKAKVPD